MARLAFNENSKTVASHVGGQKVGGRAGCSKFISPVKMKDL